MPIHDVQNEAITRRDLYGTRLELLFWTALVLGAPLLMLYGLAKYPPLVPEPREFTFVALGVFAVAALVLLVVRKKLMPWGDKAPAIMWLTIVVLPVIPIMGSIGFLLVANGQLDRSPSAEVQTVIVRVNSNKGVTLRSVAHPANPIFLDLTQTDHDNVERGDSVQLRVKPGTLGVAWISGYRLRRMPAFTPRPRT